MRELFPELDLSSVDLNSDENCPVTYSIPENRNFERTFQ